MLELEIDELSLTDEALECELSVEELDDDSVELLSVESEENVEDELDSVDAVLWLELDDVDSLDRELSEL